jgi:hypothetical protein
MILKYLKVVFVIGDLLIKAAPKWKKSSWTCNR